MAGAGGAGSCLLFHKHTHRCPGRRPLSTRATSGLLAGPRASESDFPGSGRGGLPGRRSPASALSHRSARGAPTRRARSDALAFSNQTSNKSQRPAWCFLIIMPLISSFSSRRPIGISFPGNCVFQAPAFSPHDLQELCVQPGDKISPGSSKRGAALLPGVFLVLFLLCEIFLFRVLFSWRQNGHVTNYMGLKCAIWSLLTHDETVATVKVMDVYPCPPQHTHSSVLCPADASPKLSPGPPPHP